MSWKNDQVSREETEKILSIARGMLEIPGDSVINGMPLQVIQ